MKRYRLACCLSYTVAVLILGVYGIEVCPYVEGLGYGRIVPIFMGGFILAFAVRIILYRDDSESPMVNFRQELSVWIGAGLVLSVFNHLVLDFPLGSGAKVLVGTVALAIPVCSYWALLVERDQIMDAQASDTRRTPVGPPRSVAHRLNRLVLVSQILLSIVIILLMAKDLVHIMEDIQAGREPAYISVFLEITAAFAILLILNALVTRRYAANLDLLLNGQLAGMDVVAGGRFDVVVPVVANDEFGQMGDRINTMIESLQERERIKAIFGKLVSPQVAQSFLESDEGSTLGGREINAVVLFTDLRDFTSISETCHPTGVVELLNEYFTMVVAAIHDHGGVVDKFIGDAAMGIFGLEQGSESEDAPERAVRAALAIRKGLLDVNRRLEARGLPQVDNGIGIHLGVMVAGNIGSRDRLEYTVIGDAVNVAARLESLCKKSDYPVLCSRECWRRISSELQDHFVDLGAFELKGKQGSVQVYGGPRGSTA